MGGSSLAGELPWSIVDPSTLLNARGDARERMRVAARGAISAAYARAPGACGARAARVRRARGDCPAQVSSNRWT
jgi:hypothetical protein